MIWLLDDRFAIFSDDKCFWSYFTLLSALLHNQLERHGYILHKLLDHVLDYSLMILIVVGCVYGVIGVQIFCACLKIADPVNVMVVYELVMDWEWNPIHDYAKSSCSTHYKALSCFLLMSHDQFH